MRLKFSGALAALGALIVVAGFVATGLHVLSFGLPMWTWQAIGAGLFLVSLMTVVFGHKRRSESDRKSAGGRTESSANLSATSDALITEQPKESAPRISRPPTLEKDAADVPTPDILSVAKETPVAAQLAEITASESSGPEAEKAGTDIPVSGASSALKEIPLAAQQEPVQVEQSPTEIQEQETDVIPPDISSTAKRVLLARLHRQSKPLESTPAKVKKQEPSISSPWTSVVGGRTFVDVTTDYLKTFYKEHTAAESWKLAETYVGKWMKVTGSVDSVRVVSGANYVSSKDSSSGIVFMYFDREWSRPFFALKPGNHFSVAGQVRDVSPSYISLEKCELLKD